MRLALGDVHGRDFWKHPPSGDIEEYYITGDYFDSFTVPFNKQYRNFIELCAAARADSRIKLCLGNHDYQYMRGVLNQRYSGFQDAHSAGIMEILEKNVDLLNVLYVTSGPFIVSHAGVSVTFMEKMKKAGVKDLEGINRAFFEDRNILAFDGQDIYGDDVTQSPIWIRPDSLCRDAVPGYSQIAGHTQIEKIREIPLDEGRAVPAPRGRRAAPTIRPASPSSGRKLVLIDTGDTPAFYRF
ncbi:MAG: metallophosphoesterase [Treponema sp.]|jgi:hypothetical protein|nr:metallophosphoesterase [Treponema sp.]